jgi:hypothetical protein
MSCPRNTIHGNPDCHVVPHPDWPNQSFCATCKRKFNDNGLGLPLPIIFVIVMLLAGFVMSIDTRNPTPSPTELQQSYSRLSLDN